MVILLEALGVLVFICGAILVFMVRGRHRKIPVVACTILLLLECVGGITLKCMPSMLGTALPIGNTVHK